MPLYDFSCSDCGTTFERLVRKESDVELVDCPDCGGRQVTRELSLPARPTNAPQILPSACGQGPPCGKRWCQRQG